MDNKGNSFLTAKNLTTKYPLCCVMMEISHQLSCRKAEITLDRVSREQDQDADDISKGDIPKSDPKKRVEVDTSKFE
eukprot:8470868-Karenia_brevis.AAC.1